MFKVGDKVVGNDPSIPSLFGITHTVSWVGDEYIYLEGSEDDGWLPERFTLASEYNTVEVVKEENALESVNSALAVQEGGTHYKKCGIQPVEYIQANGLDYFQGNVVKYTTRHKDKNGKEDIKKAIHYLQLILELQYGEKQ